MIQLLATAHKYGTMCLMIVKPKRIGISTIPSIMYSDGLSEKIEEPVYEYRGYYIVRQTHINSAHYFEIYTAFDGTRATHFDFYLNHDKTFTRLKHAASAIDLHLDRDFTNADA